MNLNQSKCAECGSTDIGWHSDVEVNNSVVQGRLNTNDIKPIFYLGCNYCSETLQIVSGDDLAAELTARVVE